MMILDPPCSLAPNKDQCRQSRGGEVVVDCFLSSETVITVKIRQKAPAVIVNSKI